MKNIFGTITARLLTEISAMPASRRRGVPASLFLVLLLAATCAAAPRFAFIDDVTILTGYEPVRYFSGSAAETMAGDYVPDGLSRSEWAGIRAAYEAGRHPDMLDMLDIAAIGQQAYVTTREIYRRIERDTVHFLETDSGATLVCTASLSNSQPELTNHNSSEPTDLYDSPVKS